jgi:hypothetical protein
MRSTILVARAAATVWEVKRSASGVIRNLAKKTAYVNHYSFQCAARRLVVSPIQLGGTWRSVSGSDGLPGSKR